MSKEFWSKIACGVFMLSLLLIPNSNAQITSGTAGGVFEIDGDLDEQSLEDWHGLINADDSINGDPTKIFHVVDGIKKGDQSVFAKSDKVFHDPNTYNWKSGSVPQKDDMENCNFYLFHAADNDLWAVMSGDRRATNGNSYIDFEFLQNTLTKNLDGTFTSFGPHGGRTIGDILVTIELTRGGTEPLFFMQRWDVDGNGYNYFDVDVPAGAAFVAANIETGFGEIPVSYDAFESPTYEINAFGEGGVNLTELIFGSDTCQTISTMFIRTKSSSSRTAQLKDMCDPIQLNICIDEEAPVLTIPGDFTINCENFDIANLLTTDYGTPSATDNCENINIDREVSFTPTCGNSGIIEIVYTATDECDNTDEKTQIVEVIDVTNPVIICGGNQSITCDEAVVWGIPAVSDNCTAINDILVQLVFDDESVLGCVTTLTRTWRATDECGNWSECTQVITVTDEDAPELTIPADYTIKCEDFDIADLLTTDYGASSAIDACDGEVDVDKDISFTPTCGNSGVIEIVYSAEDNCGNSVEKTQTVEVYDETKPIITCAADKDISCEDDLVWGDPTVSDNCTAVEDITLELLVDDESVEGCVTTLTRTWRATDECGNWSECTQVITVTDEDAPDLTIPADYTIKCEDWDIANLLTTNYGVSSAVDACDGEVDVDTDISFTPTCGNSGVIEIVYSAADNCGNSVEKTQTVEVVDETKPIITCAADKDISCEVPVVWGTPTVSDNCTAVDDITLELLVDDESVLGCVTTLTRTWRATDECGNWSECTQVITVTDEDAPDLTIPGDYTIKCEDFNIADLLTINYGASSAIDACDGEVDVDTDISFTPTCGNSGVIEIVYSAADNCGNSVEKTQTVEVYDETKPIITCAADKGISCEVPVVWGTPTVSDNCTAVEDITLELLVDNESVLGCVTTLTRTWRATDECGNWSECTQVITVTDEDAPDLTIPADYTIKCEDFNIANLLTMSYGASSAVDACDGPVDVDRDISFTPTCGNSGVIEIVYSAEDNCGNSVEKTQTVEVYDETKPIITCAADKDISCEVPVVWGTPTVSDNCTAVDDITLELLVDDESVLGCVTTLTRTWRATDECGNWSECTQVITVTDEDAPDLTIPADYTIKCEDFNIADLLTMSYGASSAVDACDGEVDVDRDISFTPTCGNSGVIEIVYSAADNCGNSVEKTQTVEVYDETKPIITCAADQRISCEDAVVWGTPTVSDNCTAVDDITLELLVDDESVLGCVTTLTRTWRATDECGNWSECTQVITITDEDAPELTIPADYSIKCEDWNIANLLTTNYGASSAVDACDGPVDVDIDISFTPTCGNSGVIEIVYSAADNCGNSVEKTQTVEVYDETKPIISCGANQKLECDEAVVWGTPSATDNCTAVNDILITLVFNDESTVDCLTTLTKTWRATDECGNWSECTQVIEITDSTKPVITPLDDIDVQCIGDVPPANINDVSAIDNCDPNPVVKHEGDTPEGDDCFKVITRVYSVTDNCGNSDTVIQYITVEDTQVPTLTIPASGELDCLQTASYVITANDNCDGDPDISINVIGDPLTYDLVETGNGTFDITLLVTTSVTIEATATDECGNVSVTKSFDLSSDCTDICETGKPITLTMRYTKGGCAVTDHSQGDKVSCEESNGGVVTDDGTAYIVASNKNDTGHPGYIELFSGNVAVDGVFVVDGTVTSRGDLVGNTTIKIYTDNTMTVLLEEVTFHTSCSAPLIPGDQYGSSRLLAATTDGSLLEL